jgi:hypothetical protein
MDASLYKVNTRENVYTFIHKIDKDILDLNRLVEGCRLRARAILHDDEFNVKTLEEHFIDEMHVVGFNRIYAHNYYIKQI